jgi:hypothetical protein
VSTGQRIVRKDLDDLITAGRYRNNITDVFINQLQLAQGYFQQDGTATRETLRYFRQFFDDRLINRDLWTALTPDHRSRISCLNLTSLFAMFVFIFCRLTSGAFTIDSSTPTFRINLNEHPIYLATVFYA